MCTQHRINTKRLYFLKRVRNNMNTEEDILVIYRCPEKIPWRNPQENCSLEI